MASFSGNRNGTCRTCRSKVRLVKHTGCNADGTTLTTQCSHCRDTGYACECGVGKVRSQIAAQRFPMVDADLGISCRGLANEVLPVGGWAVYGVQYEGAGCPRMQDAARAWLHGRGGGAAPLNGWEPASWAAGHDNPAGLRDRT